MLNPFWPSCPKLHLAIFLLGTMALAAPQIEPPPLAGKMSERDREITIATYERLTANAVPLAVGDSEEALLTRLGEPDGAMAFGNKKQLSFDAGYAIVSEGKIVQLSDISTERLCAPDPKSYETYQRARGMIHYMGRWMTVEDGLAAYEKALDDQDRSQERISKGQRDVAARTQRITQQEVPFMDIRKKGARIKKDDLVVPGRITVVEFYADWCAPCKQIAPYLVKLSEHPDVVVRKVDIVDWSSPVAKQWTLQSIPNMRVFDQNGQPVGKPTHDFKEIVGYIQQAIH